MSYETEIVESLPKGEGWTFICGHHPRFRPESECKRTRMLQQHADTNGYKINMKHFKGKRYRELAVLMTEVKG